MGIRFARQDNSLKLDAPLTELGNRGALQREQASPNSSIDKNTVPIQQGLSQSVSTLSTLDRTSIQRMQLLAQSPVTNYAESSASQGVHIEQRPLRERQDNALQAARLAAIDEANLSFSRDPAAGPDSERIKTRLRGIAETNGLGQSEAQGLFEAFRAAYERSHQEQFDQLSWVKRKWYGARRWLGQAWDGIKSFGNDLVQAVVNVGAAVVKGVKYVASTEGRQQIAGLIAGGARGLFSKEFWRGVGSGLKAIGAVLTSPATWKTLGGLALKAVGAVAKAIVSFAIAVVTDPARAAGMLWKAMKFIGSMAKEMVVGGFVSLYHAVKCMAKNDWKGALMHLAFAAMDLGMIAATVLTAGTAGVALAGWVAGRMALRSVLKKAVQAAAKNYFKQMGEQIGKRIVAKASWRLSAATCEKAAERAVGRAVVKLGRTIGRHGDTALTEAAVRQSVRSSVKRESRRLLKKAGIPKLISQEAESLFRGVAKKNWRKLARELHELGLCDKRVAQTAAKAMKKTVAKRGSATQMRGVLARQIEREIRAELEHKMEKTVRAQLARAFKGDLTGRLSRHSTCLRDALERQAMRAAEKQCGKRAAREEIEVAAREHVQKLTTKYVDAGHAGMRDGIRDATNKIVRRSLGKALKQVRQSLKGRSRRLLRPDLNIGELAAYGAAELGAIVLGVSAMRGAKRVIEANRQRPPEMAKRVAFVRKIEMIGGKRHTVVYRIHATGDFERVSSYQEGATSPKDRKDAA